MTWLYKWKPGIQNNWIAVHVFTITHSMNIINFDRGLIFQLSKSNILNNVNYSNDCQGQEKHTSAHYLHLICHIIQSSYEPIMFDTDTRLSTSRLYFCLRSRSLLLLAPNLMQYLTFDN